MKPQTRAQEFRNGIIDEIPTLLGVAPLGLIFGALADNARIIIPAAQAMSSTPHAGSSQFIATQMISAGTSGLMFLLVVFVVNLRPALYSASVAPYLWHLSLGWKFLLAYLLTDEPTPSRSPTSTRKVTRPISTAAFLARA